jgi:hypothetical protein
MIDQGSIKTKLTLPILGDGKINSANITKENLARVVEKIIGIGGALS